MDKQQFLKKCRFYKGEPANPYEGTDKALLWFCESKWVEMSLNTAGNGLLADYVSEYNTIGLYDFERDDNTPQTLKALLYNRFTHLRCGDYQNPPEFKKWYLSSYMGNL